MDNRVPERPAPEISAGQWKAPLIDDGPDLITTPACMDPALLILDGAERPVMIFQRLCDGYWFGGWTIPIPADDLGVRHHFKLHASAMLGLIGQIAASSAKPMAWPYRLHRGDLEMKLGRQADAEELADVLGIPVNVVFAHFRLLIQLAGPEQVPGD